MRNKILIAISAINIVASIVMLIFALSVWSKECYVAAVFTGISGWWPLFLCESK